MCVCVEGQLFVWGRPVQEYWKRDASRPTVPQPAVPEGWNGQPTLVPGLSDVRHVCASGTYLLVLGERTLHLVTLGVRPPPSTADRDVRRDVP